MIKFPYGLCDFGTLRSEGYFYADRTGRIPVIEECGRQLLFLRPRRFGKSLLLSMLEHYYDVAKADAFEQLFGELAIGKQPTALRNSYFILKWDFSVIDAQGNHAAIRRALFGHINESIRCLLCDYARFFERKAAVIDPDNALISLQSLLTAVRRTPYQLYLLIDEYDNFANEVFMGDQQGVGQRRYEELLQGEGVLKTVFKAVKAAASGRGLDRVFITGVSPLVLSDMTSGYNVAESISLDAELNDLCGFSEAEIQATLELMVQEGSVDLPPVQECVELMRCFYNGYCFSPRSGQRVYNPTLSLYLFKALQKEGRFPEVLLDENLAMDRGKLRTIARLPNGPELIEAAIDGSRPLTLPTLAQRFGIQDIVHGHKDEAFMLSFLYFFGVLTLHGHGSLGKLRFGIPNLVIRQLYVEQLRELCLPSLDWEREVTPVAEAFYTQGDLSGVCALVQEQCLGSLSNRDYGLLNELTVKTAFVLVLANDRLYQWVSERAVGRGYADLVMLVRPDCRHYELLDLLLEFKYVSLQSLGLSGQQLRELTPEECWSLEQVQKTLAEGLEQVQRYSIALEQEQAKALRLRSFVVVALGLETILWREVNAKHLQ